MTFTIEVIEQDVIDSFSSPRRALHVGTYSYPLLSPPYFRLSPPFFTLGNIHSILSVVGTVRWLTSTHVKGFRDLHILIERIGVPSRVSPEHKLGEPDTS